MAYSLHMIESIDDKALKQAWTKDNFGGIKPDWRRKVSIILTALDNAVVPTDLDVPGMGFHALKGHTPTRFAVWVSRNWRITFSWSGENATHVMMEDYHGS